MKKIATIFLSLLMTCATVLPIAGCIVPNGNNSSSSGTEKEVAKDSYLALNAYEIELKEGETFSLDVKKYSAGNEEETIKTISYGSDSATIATVNDGTITAVQSGQTYITVTADGLEVACFVTVKKANLENGLVIRFSTQNLYQGIKATAKAYIVQEGITVAEPTVTWSTEDTEALEIDETTGLVTPKQITESATIKATCEYAGKSYEATKEISIVAPVYYAFSAPTISIVSNKTLSGETNELGTEEQTELYQINVLSGETIKLTATDFTATVADETLVGVDTKDDGTIDLTSKGVGKTVLTATVKDSGEMVRTRITTIIPIGSVKDMDILALACANEPSLLAQNYVLINDIDYNGDVIMPIAPYKDGSARVLGVQWKYRLTKTTTGYEWVNRADVGKANKGLSDKEFVQLNADDGLNATNKYAFTGTFDGNGYSIKNGKIFYGIYTVTTEGKRYASYSNIFGIFNGTLKNIGFENISTQSPADLTVEGSTYGLDRTLVDNELVDGGLTKPEAGGYYTNGVSIVGTSTNGIFENVYFDLTVSVESTSLAYGALCCLGYEITLRNCVGSVNDPVGKVRALRGSVGGSSLICENNLTLGAGRIEAAIDWRLRGQDGNWWSETLVWQDIFNVALGANAENVRTLENTIKTFDTSVWDMSNFAADKEGRPTLLKGCSVK